ncbi:hypothetical protein QBC34DRAFT_121890 [Podospora aff. communis PSN243]|uniref:Uncharacterized protein n=1 Tax=Podospora aff. communis PSN243 TaxID=3040156 RepID=A0AAV9GKQ0_9PEZI|nr:hypothetical protein QBC34DRAFT_121890 [Podospora aff. communis PSN243]
MTPPGIAYASPGYRQYGFHTPQSTLHRIPIRVNEQGHDCTPIPHSHSSKVGTKAVKQTRPSVSAHEPHFHPTPAHMYRYFLPATSCCAACPPGSRFFRHAPSRFDIQGRISAWSGPTGRPSPTTSPNLHGTGTTGEQRIINLPSPPHAHHNDPSSRPRPSDQLTRHNPAGQPTSLPSPQLPTGQLHGRQSPQRPSLMAWPTK